MPYCPKSWNWKLNAASKQYLLVDIFLITCFWIMIGYCKEKIDFSPHLDSRLSESELVIGTVIIDMSVKSLFENVLQSRF